MKLKELLIENNIEINHFEDLINAVVDLNLTLPVSINRELNHKTYIIEQCLKKMGIEPRRKNFKVSK